MRLSLPEFRRRLASRTLDPIYLLVGDDEGARERGVEAVVAAACDPDLLAFNCDRLRGDEATGAAIVDCANTLPMMSQRRLVIVSRAADLDEADETALEPYLRSPSGQTCLVFVATKLDGRRKFTAILQRAAMVVEFRAPEDPRSAERWVVDYASRLGAKIEAPAAALLVEHTGVDLPRLGSALDKAVLFAGAGRPIDVEAVRLMLGPAAAPDVFVMTDAIGDGRVAVALAAARRLTGDGEHPLRLMGLIGWYVRTRLDRRLVRSALDRMLDTDLKMKGSGGDPVFLLERLLVDLCALGRRARSGPAKAGGAR